MKNKEAIKEAYRHLAKIGELYEDKKISLIEAIGILETMKMCLTEIEGFSKFDEFFEEIEEAVLGEEKPPKAPEGGKA